MRWTFLLLLGMSYFQECDLQWTSSTTTINGAFVEFDQPNPRDTVRQAASINLNRKVSGLFEPAKYERIRTFFSRSDGTFTYKFRHQPGIDYYLSMPPGKHFGYALPQYIKVRKGRVNLLEFRVKPIKQIVQVDINCRHSLPDGIRLKSSITTPYASDQRLLYDRYFLITRPDTTLLLPGVPNEPHRITASAYHALEDTTIEWSHSLEVLEDTVYIDFNF